jgi:uncharacterized membrane protein
MVAIYSIDLYRSIDQNYHQCIHLDRRWRTPHLLRKTLAFGAAHLVVSVGVGYALTGSFVLAGLFAFIEPALNTMAHYAFERWWARAQRNVVAVSATAGVGD